MYQIDNTSFDKQAFPAGIHQNVELKEISINELDTQNFKGTVLKFRFEDETSFFEHAEFPVDEANSRANALKWQKDPDRQYAEDLNSQAKRIAHILSCYVPKEKLFFKVESWEEFCAKIKELVGEAHAGVKVRIKLILDKKDYTRFPGSTISAFIQRMDQPNKLTINPKYDRIIPAAPDTEPTGEAPAAAAGTADVKKW